MEILVMNRARAITYSHKYHEEKSVLISINNIIDEPAHISRKTENGILAVLRLFFDDVDYGNTAMTTSDANKIAEFVHRYQYSVDRIIVHCEAGQSRSAGVAAAIMLYLFGNDDLIFDDPKYRPNMFCYRKTLNALGYHTNCCTTSLGMKYPPDSKK